MESINLDGYIFVKLLKYFAGSLIISFGVLIVISLIVRAIGIALPSEIARY